MTLYHYTTARVEHLGSILRTGEIQTTDSLLFPESKLVPHPSGAGMMVVGVRPAPAVVWLTSDPELHLHPDRALWARRGSVNPTDDLGRVHELRSEDDHLAIRITVEIRDSHVFRWESWATNRGIAPDWMESTKLTGGDWERWYVIPRNIPRREWREILWTQTGEKTDPFGKPL